MHGRHSQGFGRPAAGVQVAAWPEPPRGQPASDDAIVNLGACGARPRHLRRSPDALRHTQATPTASWLPSGSRERTPRGTCSFPWPPRPGRVGQRVARRSRVLEERDTPTTYRRGASREVLEPHRAVVTVGPANAAPGTLAAHRALHDRVASSRGHGGLWSCFWFSSASLKS